MSHEIANPKIVELEDEQLGLVWAGASAEAIATAYAVAYTATNARSSSAGGTNSHATKAISVADG